MPLNNERFEAPQVANPPAPEKNDSTIPSEERVNREALLFGLVGKMRETSTTIDALDVLTDAENAGLPIEDVSMLCFQALNPENIPAREELKREYPDIYEVLEGMSDWHPSAEGDAEANSAVSEAVPDEARVEAQSDMEHIQELSDSTKTLVGDIMDAYKAYQSKDATSEDKISSIATINTRTKDLTKNLLEARREGELGYLMVFRAGRDVGRDDLHTHFADTVLQRALSWATRYTGMTLQEMDDAIERLKQQQ